ncbi:MAG TPA: hypothetical protein VF939_19265 [Puia sp.]
MKTISINPVSRLKFFLALVKAKMTINFREAEREGLAVTDEGTLQERGEKEKARRFSEFQRRAHIGNYFAGPVCVFDPRLFKH